MCGPCVIYVIEPLVEGGNLWLFWRAGLDEWVSELARASLYDPVDALQLADRLSADENVQALAISRNLLIDWP